MATDAAAKARLTLTENVTVIPEGYI